jgi:Protein of unknown function (DUF1553)/Protein of unknown function (DUF1549)/Planctomycete cytochrome C
MKILLLATICCSGLIPVNSCVADDSRKESRPAGPQEQVEFFNTKVRPLLAARCWRCHGADRQRGGLRLDSLAATLRGGDTGAAMVPGKPDESLLIEAVRYEGYEMPPDVQLPAGEVAVLTRWVEMGSPWPDGDVPTGEHPAPTTDARVEINRAADSHWAFQPVRRPNVPNDGHDDWSRNQLDRFVRRKMQQNPMTPSPRAGRRTLLRRAYLDLIGMPPTPHEMKRFLSDESSSAFSTVVDDLLDDPRYGERWARHWLDVARYADSKGAIFGETRQYPYAYTYRDYVIDSLNDDKPFNDFIREQLAADMMTEKVDDPSLAALAFLTIHKRSNGGGITEQRADRVDTVCRALLGLTVACARCHDHKYDPLTMVDFYSLYGVFASLEEPDELPVIGRPESGSALEKSFLELEAEEDRKLQQYRDENFARIMQQIRGDIGKYLQFVHDQGDLPDGQFRTAAGRRKLNPYIALRWKKYLTDKARDAVFGPWTAFAALPDGEFQERAAEIAVQVAEDNLPECHLNPFVAAAFAKHPAISLQDIAATYQKLFDEIEQSWNDVLAANAAATSFDDPDRERLRQILYGSDAPGVIPAGDFKMLDRPVFLKLITMNANRTLRLALHPGSPRRAMVVRDTQKVYDARIFIRGNKDRPGARVPRQFIELLGGPDRKPFVDGAGRLELANAVVAPDNPLTARVIVNRVWAWHFGRGLVATPSDFGLRSSPPTHPELLDWLTSEFVESGWSIKHLHRVIMTSATYQQASHSNEQKLAIDPDNRLLWRFNRRRLEYEAIHDSMLAVSGKLDATRGGPASLMVRNAALKQNSDKATWDYNPYRRAVYAAIERDKLPTLLLTFDFANPDETNARRDITTVPTQSLYLMNGDFTMEMATALIARKEIQNATESHQRIRRLYDRVFNREPSDNELLTAVEFIATSRRNSPGLASGFESTSRQSAWTFGYAPYDAGRIQHDIGGLKSFPHAEPAKLQGDRTFPDKTNGFGWLRLTPAGGHAGGGSRCLVRRWTSPITGVVRLRGSLRHAATQGDGIRASIYVGNELVGQWSAHNQDVSTSVPNIDVTEGDQITFVIDSIENGGWDGFQWAPEVVSLAENNGALEAGKVWSSRNGFPKSSDTSELPTEGFGPWERLAQVLLMSNEFVFLE